MKELKIRSLLKKIPFIVLIITVIAFFAIPSFIFAEGDGVATTETTQTAVTQDTSAGTDIDTSGVAAESTDADQTTTTETTTSGQTLETAVADTTETVTTETPASETITTEQTAAETLVNTETQNNERTDVVNTEVVYSPSISTDKADYNPGEAAAVSGTGFKPGDKVEITFFNAIGEIEFTGLVMANEQGNFIYNYSILGSAEYKVIAKSTIDNTSVTTNFLDSAYATFSASGPSLAGSQFYEERMDMNVIPSVGTSISMYAFCIDLQHYLDTGGTWDAIGFKDYNDPDKNPAGKLDTTLVTWKLPASVYALARGLDPAWLNSDDSGSGGFTMAQKAAAVQEAFWTLVSAADKDSTVKDGNNFNYLDNGIPAIQGLVITLITNANKPEALIKSVTITPTSNLDYLKDTINLNKHDLYITTYDYLGNVITGVNVNLTVTGNGFFDALNKTVKSITATSGNTISLYADKDDYSGVNIGTDLINGYVDVNGNHNIDSSSLPVNESTDLIGSILWPNNRSFPQSSSLPWGSNQMLILTGLYEPQAQATEEWRIPGEITVHKSDGVYNVGLAGAIISLLDGSGNQAKDAWGMAVTDQITDVNGDIPGFKGLAWGTNPNEFQGVYIVHEKTAPTGYNLAADIPVTIPSIDTVGLKNTNIEGTNSSAYDLNAETKIFDTRIPGQLRLTKTNSVTKLPVAGATYNIYDSYGNIVEIITTGTDGSAAVTLQNWGTYTVKEAAILTGYNLDPSTYSVAFNATNTSITLNVSDSPVVTDGGTVTVAGLTEVADLTEAVGPTEGTGLIEVAGLTEVAGLAEGTAGGIQVLAFTGQDPIIPIAGLAALMAGLAMVAITLSKRQALKWKHAKIESIK